MNLSLRRIVPVLLFAVVVLTCFAVGRDVSRTRAALASFDSRAFAAACALALGNYLLRFLKWEFYLARLGIRTVPKVESLLIFLSGFVLTVTPGKVGEVFKSVVLETRQGIALARTAPIVLAERLTDVAGVVVLIAVGTLDFSGGGLWASLGAAIVALALVSVSSRRVADAAFSWMERSPAAHAVPKLREAHANLRALVAPGALVVPSLLSIAAWGLECLALAVIVRGFGVEVSLTRSTFFYATATLAGALVPVPGGLGITEGMLQEQLVHLGGVEGSVATVAMILVRLATLWFAVVVGLVAYGALRWLPAKPRTDGVTS